MGDDADNLGSSVTGGDDSSLELRLAKAEAEAAHAADYADKLSDRLARLEAQYPKMQQAAQEAERKSVTDPRIGQHQHDIDELYRLVRRFVEATGASGGGNVDIWQLQKDGGSLGAVGARSTWTYSLFDKDTSAAIAGGTHIPLTGNGQRIASMPTTYGSWGIGYIGADGLPRLVWADETYDWNLCLETP